jgi:hypothetical protein
MNINHIIDLTEKKLFLLKELKESIQYENSTYHLIKLGEEYLLFSIKEKRLVRSFKN